MSLENDLRIVELERDLLAFSWWQATDESTRATYRERSEQYPDSVYRVLVKIVERIEAEIANTPPPPHTLK